MEINHGVIPGKLPSDWISGAIKWENRNPSGNWYPYLVHGERQYFQGGNFGDSMACVSFATNNVMEIQIKQQTGVELNFSDRFLAKMSGTTMQGNRVSTVLDTFRKYGAVPEALWPMPTTQTFDNYYIDIPASVIAQAKSPGDVQYEYILDHSPATVKHELQHAPLLITIPGHEITGIVVDADDTHLTILDDYEFNIDPANPFVRKILLSDVTDIFKAVLTVRKDSMNLVNDNGTYYLVGDKGKLGIADPDALAMFKMITSSEQTGTTAGVPEVKVIKKGFIIE